MPAIVYTDQRKSNTADARPAKRPATEDRKGGSSAAAAAAGGGLTRTLAAMRQRQAGSGSGADGGGERTAGTSSKTRFHELLVDGWEGRNSREAFLEELRLQAQLAKRLGSSKKDALDGMDKLMGWLSAGSKSMLPKYVDSDPAARAEAEELLAKAGAARAKAAKAARLAAAAADEQDPILRSKQLAAAGGAGAAATAAAAARRAAELLDRESDEELEFLGIDPGTKDMEDGDDEEEDRYDGFGDGSESGSDLEDEEEETGSEEGMGGAMRGRGGRWGEGNGSDDDEGEEGDDEGEDEEDEEDESDDGYDMMGHMFGASSDEEADVGEGGSDSEDGGEGEDEDEDEGEDEGEGEDEDEGGADMEGGSSGSVGEGESDKDEEGEGVERRVTGLVNRLAESNLQPIAREVAELYGSHGRRLVSEAVAAQILGAAETGPRASEQFAAVAAAFVTAVAALAEAADLAAAFLAQLAERLEAARGAGDSLAQTNLVTLLSYCYSAGLVGPGLLYGLLGALRERFEEPDVAAMVTLLNAVGLQLRNADPALMKDFVLGIHTRAAELGSSGQLSRRAQLMLDLIIDIKNNKTSAAGGAAAAAAAAPNVSLGGTALKKGKGAAAAAGATGAAGGGRRGGSLAVLQPSVAKWLQGIGVDEICLRGLTWKKLLQPGKKGMWWVPAAGEALDEPLLAAVGGGGAAASTADPGAAAAAAAAASDANAASTAKLLALAAAQRMNTDVRRAVFVAIMGSEDCAEAHEKLLRLPLKGDQRREIMRVLVDCCLAEKAWNPYYALLALRLCGGGGGGAAGGGGGGGGGGSAGRAQRVTVQYCLWDKFKEIETMSPLISGLLLFLRSSFAPWLATRPETGPEIDELLRRTRLAEKELAAGATAAAAVLV
ncbi:hypothetical protein GPECTOR_55g326 [Gonium pectorale]|uniref:MI domain-containing protein n=1 Tax=Gonium pectorale TaxID=33097 RepID=A0A150G7U8_GONPE|nr:hypothetical protein GPECTOR_55g326 [Gonium pectorale]|eukprot:KXZ45420.1 hypothetical protein GPECTOR_55g326 [Gonium pectorale]